MRLNVARLLVLPLLILAGCGAALPAKEVTLKVPISIHSNTEPSVAGGDKADLTTFQEYKDVKAILASVTLKSVSFNVKSVGAENAATNATGKLTLAAKGTTLDLGLYSAAVVAGTKVDVAFDQAAADKLAEVALSAEPQFDVAAAGTVDAVPAFFEAEAVFVIELQAGFKMP